MPKSDLIFNVIDWKDKDDFEDEDSESNMFTSSYVIEAFGRTEEGKSVCLKISGYTPYFFVEIPKDWKDASIKRFIDYVKTKVYGKHVNNLIAYDVVKKHKLYGFTAGKKFKFLRLVFSTNESMRKYSWIFMSKHKIPGIAPNFTEFKLYESNIPPMLRFMHIKNLNSCGWIKVKKDKYIKGSKREFNSDIVAEAEWDDIENYDNTSISKLRILSYDIECTSGDGSFPQANRDTDKIIQIGSTFSYNGEEDCYFKHIITLGSCDEIEGAEVESYDTEEEVLLAWQKLVIRMDPDIITGYNIFGFDNKYVYDRANYLGVNDRFGYLSRIKNLHCEFIDTQLSSSALGDNKIRYYNMNGRVQIDLMKVVMKDYKLNSYKLDSVAEEFLNGKVIKLDGINLEVDSTRDLKVGSYLKLVNSEEELVEDGKKFKILEMKGNILTLDKSPETEDSKLSWTMAKDDVKPEDIFRLQKGSSADRKIVAEYCIQDCALVNKLIARLCVVINNIGMANVCIVPLSFLFFRGQGIKIFSLVAKECRMENYLIPVIKKNDDDKGGYEGATVFEPSIGFYKRPIAVLDYASLYPSSMIHKNLSHETFVDNAQYDNHPDYIYYNCTYNNADGSKTHCKYAKKKDGTMGIMPMILSKLLKQRKATKKLMGKEDDPFMKSIYDGQQLAYKVTANSLYGQLGSSVSPIYFKQIAASTTSTGREMLELARDYMENVFPNIVMSLYEAYTKNDGKKVKEIIDEDLVESLHNEDFLNETKEKIIKIISRCTIEPKTIYGDTDSVFIDFGLKVDGEYLESKEALEYAIELGELGGNFIKMKMHAPQDLEYEKTFYPFCILSKKRYVGNKYEFDKNKFKQNSMGIVLKRRDNAKIVKKIVGGMVDILLNEIDIEKAVEYIKTSISDLLKGKYPLYNFVTSKTLKSNYVDRTRIAHVVLADRMRERDPGSAPLINERVPYAAIVVEERKGMLQGDRIEHPDYIIEKNLRVDYLFYLTNQIKNPTVQFLELLTEDPENIFNEAISIEKNRRAGNVSIDNFFKVKGKSSQLKDLKVSKRPSKNLARYYLNEDNMDTSELEKLGLLDEVEEEIKNEEEDDETNNTLKHKKLFLNLS